MACACTMKYRSEGNVTLGYDRVECDECKVARVAHEKKLAIDAEIAQKKQYLKDTDYLILRQMEQSPLSVQEFEMIKAMRQDARDRINELQA